MKKRLDNALRKLLTAHKQGDQKNIVILSTPRSGSTWLLEILGTASKLQLVREPLNLRKPAVVKDLGISDWDQLYDSKNKTKVLEYLLGFINGASRNVNHKREKPFSPTWHPFTNRALYKILHGVEHWVEDLKLHLNAEVILLVRHPIPVSLSRKVHPRLKTMLDNNAWFLNEEQQELAQGIVHSSDHFSLAILDWCLQNLHPLELAKEDKVFLVTYEELTLHPEEVLGKISEKVQLDIDDSMRQMITKPSGSTGQSDSMSKALLEQHQNDAIQREQLVNKWRPLVNEQEKEKADRILKTFGMDIYSVDSPIANPDFLLLKNGD